MPKTTAKKIPSKKFPKSNGNPSNNQKQFTKAPEKKSTSQFSTNPDASLQQLFIGQLREAYWMENHLVKAIPKMAAAAGDKELKQALKEHVEVTKGHASRLERIFETLNEKIIAKKCDACEGLTMSGEHVIEITIGGSSSRDLGIIMSALKVENFEMISYKGLIRLATSLNKTAVAELLQQNLDEEAEASELLTELSQTTIEEPA